MGVQMAKKGKKIGRLDRNKWVVIKDKDKGLNTNENK